MASLKVKFRPSSVKDREGTLFYQIIHLRQTRQIYPGLHIKSTEWDGSNIRISKECDSQRAAHLHSIITKIESDRALFENIAKDHNRSYSIENVLSAYKNAISADGFIAYSRRLIEELKRIGKTKTAKRFAVTITSLARYTDDREIAWSEFNATLISGYEEFLLNRGLCRNSTSYYMRNLRAIANRAVEDGHELPRNPFKHVYMGVDKTIKRAVTLKTIQQIRDIDLREYPALDFARSIFMFSFYTRGMSFVDIAFLRKTDIQNGMMTYRRRKTRQLIQIKLEQPARQIISDMGENSTTYLIPIITSDIKDAETQYQNAYHRVNRNLKRIGELLNLETKLTMYVARHAWASIARSNNISIATISEAMGHDSEATTRIYLSTLDTSTVDRANSKIIKLMATE